MHFIYVQNRCSTLYFYFALNRPGVGGGSKSAHGNTGGSPIKEHGKGI